MSLTTRSLRQLRAKSFDKLYAAASEKYAEMADAALDYVQRRGTAGEKALLGDVAEILKNAVEINPAFDEHLKKGKLSPGSWSSDFTDYILEQVYPQPDLTTARSKKIR